MEDGIGTIFYILITAVVLIVTALGRKKKQGAQAQGKPPEEKVATDPFSLFEFKNEDSETEFEEEEIATVKDTPLLTNELGMIIEEGVSAFKEGSVQTEHEEERLKMAMETDNPEHQPTDDYTKAYKSKEEESSDIDDIMEKFDLKKAIIHSEIINRKKF